MEANIYYKPNNEILYDDSNRVLHQKVIAVNDYLPDEGGKVLYLFQSGDHGYVSGEQHGLIVPYDGSSYFLFIEGAGPNTMWGGCTSAIVGSAEYIAPKWVPKNNGSNIVGSGRTCTDAVINNCPTDPSPAFRLCTGLTYNGQSDWFLPSQFELSANSTFIRDNFDPPLYGNGSYWSSNLGTNSSYAYYINVRDGSSGMMVKNASNHVLPMRYF